MFFDLDPHQDSLATTTRQFAAHQIAPHRRDADRQGRYPAGLLPAMAAEGLFALRLPTTYGGRGLDAVSTGIVLEELAAADLSPCFPVLNAALIGSVLAETGTPDQLARWLPPIADGRAVVALALTEADHGTDAAAIEMAAHPAPGGGWQLTGEKTSIMLAGYATHALLFARTGGAGASGISAFYVDLDHPAVSREVLDDLGCRAGRRGRLIIDGLPVTPADLVGPAGGGFSAVMRGFGVSRPMIALMGLGVARASLEEAVEHARTRTAFGVPLGTFQGVAFPLVEHTTWVHAARLVALQALWTADQDRDPRQPANMAKWWAPKAAADAVQQALLTLGHLGWSEDGPIAQRLRDVIGLQLADGTAAATKLVVARQILGRNCAP